MSSNPSTLKKAFGWIEEQISRVPFGEISVSFSMHDGKIKRYQTGVTVTHLGEEGKKDAT